MTAPVENIFLQYPKSLARVLARVIGGRSGRFYLTGGLVRDRLLGRKSVDLDITVPIGGVDCARELARELGGAFVLLDEKEDVGRVVWRGYNVDLAAFREGAKTIDEDLKKRDFTINALGLRVSCGGLEPGGFNWESDIIDPTGGVVDLEAGLIRHTSPRVFASDPLRLLRAYRFTAALDFTIAPDTEKLIREHAGLISQTAPERLSYELQLIMESCRAGAAFDMMGDSGVLAALFPELLAGVGVLQPASHHLDVFGHSMAALREMEAIQGNPEQYFPERGKKFTGYLQQGKRRVWLKWAALFHDLGKSVTFGINKEKGDRITFYNHDGRGAAIFEEIARRFRWSRRDTVQVCRLIARHMWPFHLNNARRKTGLTAKAYLRLAKTMGEELPGLFLLAMADSLAGRGPGRPPDMESDIARLCDEAAGAYEKIIKPVLDTPRLITGHDIKQMFGVSPGSVFRDIFDGLEKARVAGLVTTREEALEWVRIFLKTSDIG